MHCLHHDNAIRFPVRAENKKFQPSSGKKNLASKTRITVLGGSRVREACGYSIDAAFPGYQNLVSSSN